MSTQALLDDHEHDRADEHIAYLPSSSSASSKGRSSRTVHSLILGFGVALCALLLAILVVLLVQRQTGTCTCDESRTRSGETHTTQYGRSTQWMSLDHKYDWLWKSESAGNNGIVRINPDRDDEEPAWGNIGMFHQLHCLTGFRHALQRARDGEDIGMDENDNAHWPHCFHYMRQAILCAADSTIERGHLWASTLRENGSVSSRRAGTIDGSADLRICRDSERLYRLRSEHGLKIEKERLEWLNGSKDQH